MIDELSRSDNMNVLQQAKYDLVIEECKPLMLAKGITALKISDISREIKVGEATIYRYFGTKTNLVIEVATSLWKDIYKEIVRLPKQETGYYTVKEFFSFFLTGYKESKEVFTFLDEFDSLMVKEKVDKDSLGKLDDVLSKIKDEYIVSFNQGLKDESIKSSVNKEEYYYTTTHMVLGICKSLASNGIILSSDELIKDVTQINLALEICLQYIKQESEK